MKRAALDRPRDFGAELAGEEDNEAKETELGALRIGEETRIPGNR
jgi:hypothetical protein